MEDIGHWHFIKDFDPEEWVGFIYRIYDTQTGRMYIGKKFFWKTIRKIVKNRKNRKKVIKSSDWKTYTGSSNWLNSEIALYGKERFRFEIESLHESRGTLAYAEVTKIILEDTLRKTLPDGTKAYFNGLCPPIKFRPGNETEKEKEYRI
jgi:hypothetical protein